MVWQVECGRIRFRQESTTLPNMVAKIGQWLLTPYNLYASICTGNRKFHSWSFSIPSEAVLKTFSSVHGTPLPPLQAMCCDGLTPKKDSRLLVATRTSFNTKVNRSLASIHGVCLPPLPHWVQGVRARALCRHWTSWALSRSPSARTCRQLPASQEGWATSRKDPSRRAEPSGPSSHLIAPPKNAIRVLLLVLGVL